MLCLWRGFQLQCMRPMPLKNTGKNVSNGRDKLIGGQQHALTVGIDLPMYEVSTTRGTPSTSINLKEALCEKIPVHYDLLRNFRRRHGPSVVSQITVDNIYQGLSGVSTMVRETSEIDPKYGIRYRGLTIPEVIALLPRQGKSPSAEAVFWLLLTGDVPTQEQTASLIADWTQRRQKRKDWWSGPDGGIVGSVLRTLPQAVTPLGRLSIALTAFDAGKYTKEAVKNGVMAHTYWEYIYEDSMELLATLPAIVGLVIKGRLLKVANEEGDWVQFLVECLSDAPAGSESHRKSKEDFLRLYIALNADEDGGVPGAHVTEILGASRLDTNQALAAGVLAYADEPKSGTMHQCMEFQSKLQSYLGRKPKEESLKNLIGTIIEKDKLIGYRESEICDPRYATLSNYVREHLPDDPDVKFWQSVTRVLTTMTKTRGRNVSPEQNSIVTPVFQFYGLKDMKLNQALLCMSRALGAIASIIWTRAIDAPVEHPRSKCTYTYFNSFQHARKKPARRKYAKHLLT